MSLKSPFLADKDNDRQMTLAQQLPAMSPTAWPGYGHTFTTQLPAANSTQGGPGGSPTTPSGQPPQNGYNYGPYGPGPWQFPPFSGFAYGQGFPGFMPAGYSQSQYPNASGPGPYMQPTGSPMSEPDFHVSSQPGGGVAHHSNRPTMIVNGAPGTTTPLVENKGKNFSVNHYTITNNGKARKKAKKAKSRVPESGSSSDDGTESE